jgi:DNA-binding NtrC family response regulator
MEGGAFRPDVFYRLAVVTLTVPPLRERREDVSRLVESYLEHFARQTAKRVSRVDERAMRALVRYDWPGNVRELINTIERAVLLCSGTQIGLEDLPARVAGKAEGVAGSLLASGTGASLPAELLSRPLAEARKRIVAAFEARYLSSLLETAGGRVGEAAHKAGVNERTLYALMRRHGLRKEDFKRRRDSR